MDYRFFNSGLRDITAILNASNGQIVSLKFRSKEYLHGGGRDETDPAKRSEDKLGWLNNSIISMWPIVNSSEGHKIIFDGEEYALGGHGILRAMKPDIVTADTSDMVHILYEYKARGVVDNSLKHNANPKYPKEMALPFDFRFYETCNLMENLAGNDSGFVAFKSTIENTSDKDLCHAFGKHPCFDAVGDPDKSFFYIGNNKEKMSLAYLLSRVDGEEDVVVEADFVEFIDSTGRKGVRVSSDCGRMQLWSPGKLKPSDNLKDNAPDIDPELLLDKYQVCIEPFTEMPRHKRISLDAVGGSYMNVLKAGEKRTYTTIIELLR